MNKRALKREIERLNGILEKANVPEQNRDALDAVILNLAIMRLKLNETCDLIMNEQVICNYDNGGNQKGTHENPLFKGYLNLWRGYLNGLEKFTSYLPKEMQTEVAGNNITVLEKVAKMKRAKS